MRTEREHSPRRVSISKKQLILQQHLELGLSVSSLARKYEVHPVTIYSWKRSYLMDEKKRKGEPGLLELKEELLQRPRIRS